MTVSELIAFISDYPDHLVLLQTKEDTHPQTFLGIDLGEYRRLDQTEFYPAIVFRNFPEDGEEADPPHGPEEG